MGASGSTIDGRVGIDTEYLSEKYGTSYDLYNASWMRFTWEEAWQRKSVKGQEGKARMALGAEMVHGERMADCQSQTGDYLRKTLFDVYKQNGPGQPYVSSFTTDTFTRCWYPWVRPKRLYTVEPAYIDHVLRISEEEYGVDRSRVSIITEKRDNRGEFHIAIDYQSQEPAPVAAA
ncbi:hypothetical protein DIPPA_16376 [Diplonema papillatum]|nr:hypothetical protein DIPPA_16376 [Diplonema papillatum]